MSNIRPPPQLEERAILFNMKAMFNEIPLDAISVSQP
jgi:hypothetical protein